MPSSSFPILVRVAGAVCLAPLCRSEPLVYQFRPGETNVYHVRLELTAEGGTLEYGGHVWLTPKRVDLEAGRATLAVRGSLTALSEPAAIPMPYRPPAYARTFSLPPYAELEVDLAGKLLAQAGDVPLPSMAGNLGASLLVPLPPPDGRTLESLAEVSLPDETPRPGMPWRPPYYEAPGLGRNAFASLTASRTTRMRAASVSSASAALTWTWELRSWLDLEGEPRLQASGEGAATLDRERGWLQEVHFHYRETSTSDAVTRRLKLTFEARLLDGDERAAALNRAAPRTARTLTILDVRTALEELTSKDQQRRADAVQKLQSDDMEPLPDEIASLAEPLLETRDDTVRWVVARVVAAAATTDHVPTLLRLLKEPESPARQPALQALGRLKDPRAIAPLVEFVARGESERYAAVEVLKEFGPEAEEAVLGLFEEQNLETRRFACQILQFSGTSRSLDVLREAMLDPDRQLRDLASQAVGPIVGRGR